MIGNTILHYQILEELGRGGMGEVYKARDTKLDRFVGLKFLPSSSSVGEDDRNRFIREAKSAAALNHPNIAHIYEIAEADGQMFIAMEYVEGQTLHEILGVNGGMPLPLKKAMSYSTQIADGLQSAHEKGIVHRDIKSANIMVTARDQVKIMDFGLAKVGKGKTVTKVGTTVGTAAYMSPEQARGESVDHRTDIWSFGVVMYEMISGRLPFKTDYEQALVYSILNEEPEPLTAIRTGVPPALESVVAKAMAKDPSMRYQHVDEIPADLRAIELKTSPTTRLPGASGISVPLKARRRPRELLLLAAAVSIVAGALLLGHYLLGGSGNDGPTLRVTIAVPPSELLEQIDSRNPTISPDGRTLVYSAQANGVVMLYARPMNSFTAAPIQGTSGGTGPFFSPDGQSIGFFADGKMKTVPVTGGMPQALCDAPVPRGGSWSDKGDIVYSPNFSTGLYAIRADGGQPKLLTDPDTASGERSYRWPQVLPGGKWVLFTVGEKSAPDFYDNARLAAFSLVNGSRHMLGIRGDMAVYVKGGYILVWRGGELYAAKFDLNTATIKSQPVAVMSMVGGDPTSGAGYFSVSNDGILAFLPGIETDKLKLVKVSLEGQIDPLPIPPGPYSFPHVSPDGQKIAVTVGEVNGSNFDIWLYDIATGAFSRFTFDNRSACGIWTHDSRQLVYSSGLGESSNFCMKPASGSSPGSIILAGTGRSLVAPVSLSPDDKELTYVSVVSRDGNEGVCLLSMKGRDKPVQLSGLGGSSYNAVISPDGKWLAYTTNVSGQNEVYVTSFPALKGKWQVSAGGGYGAVWAPDEKGIYYESISNTEMFYVPIQTVPDFSSGRPRVQFNTDRIYFPNEPIATYDIYPDGRHFIMIGKSDTSGTSPVVNLVLNWTKDMKRKLAAQK